MKDERVDGRSSLGGSADAEEGPIEQVAAAGAERRCDVGPGPFGLVIIVVLRAYQLFLSPWLGANCRFAPSCSQYAMDAIRRNGVFRGSALAARRLSRCHPFHEGGYDPAP